jgi:hypothetical protein
MRNTEKILVRKSEGKRLLGRPSVSEDSLLKWTLKIGCGAADWIQVAQHRVQWWALVNM